MDVQNETTPRLSQKERKSQAEKALLNAAEGLIAERGISNTSLAEIGERAGYSRGLVNHHFGTKETLIRRLVERAQNRFAAPLERAAGTTGRDALLAVVDIYLETVGAGGKESRAFLVLWGASFSENSPVIGFAEADLRARNRFASLIRKGQKDGSIDGSQDPQALAAIILAMLRGIAAQLLVSSKGLDQNKLRKQCRALLMSALRR